MRVAILQSNYIPWRGYFAIASMVDVFIFHDDLQYTKGDWRNRNQIRTAQGKKWLTVPCGTSEKRLISEVKLDDHHWQTTHFNKILQAYSNAEYFTYLRHFLNEIYLEIQWNYLSEMNQHIIRELCSRFLGVQTTFLDSRSFAISSTKSDRVLDLVKAVGGKTYLSGPSGANYLQIEKFESHGIDVEWMDYGNLLPYPQNYEGFEGEVTVLDLISNTGPMAAYYIK